MSDNALKLALQQWLDEQGLKIPEFANRMGYSYMHAYQLVRGNGKVTAETLGRIVLYYSPEAAAEIKNLAEKFESGNAPTTQE